MKLKKASLWAMITGFGVLTFAFLIPILHYCIFGNEASIGIIGGADAPTASMLMSSLSGIPKALILIAITVIISSVFCLVFSKTVESNCRLATTAISLGLSFFGALGFCWLLRWFIMVIFNSKSMHPIEYPVSILIGLFSFISCIALILLYVNARKGKWSLKGVSIDILTCIVYFPAHFYGLATFIDIIS